MLRCLGGLHGVRRGSSDRRMSVCLRGSGDCHVGKCSFFRLCDGSGHRYDRYQYSIHHKKVTGRSTGARRQRSAEEPPAALPADTKEIESGSTRSLSVYCHCQRRQVVVCVRLLVSGGPESTCVSLTTGTHGRLPEPSSFVLRCPFCVQLARRRTVQLQPNLPTKTSSQGFK